MCDRKIIFKTAKLAKEKGFDDDSSGYYYPLRPETKNIVGSVEVGKLRYSLTDCAGVEFKKDNNYALAPTQTTLQTWLRKTHGIHVEVYCNASGWGWILTKLNGTVIKEILDDMFFNEYEDALEAGIFEALNIIK